MNNYEVIGNSILDNLTPESSKVEYKKSHTNKESIMRSICAMLNDYANNKESYIFIGVEEQDANDKSLPAVPIIGTKFTAEAIQNNFVTSIFKGIKPACNRNVVFSDAEYQGVHYVLITIKSPHNDVYRIEDIDNETKKCIDNYPKAGVYIRESRESTWVRDYDYRIIRISERNNGYNFSRSINEEATIDDIRYEYIREYLNNANPNSDLLKLDKEQMCKDMKLITPEKIGGKYGVYNFALLMFADNPLKFFPGAYIRIVSEVGSPYNMEEASPIKGVLWRQAQNIEEYLRRNVVRTYTLRPKDSFQHKDVTNYPLRALRELVFNAIVHKDYSKNQPVEIQVFKDHLYIANPNKPVPPVRIEDLMNETHFPSRDYINPDIMEMFHQLKLVETYGSGIRIAKEELKRNGSPELRYDLKGEDNNTTTAYVFINSEYKRIDENKKLDNSSQKLDNSSQKLDNLSKITEDEFEKLLKNHNIKSDVISNIMKTYHFYVDETPFGREELLEMMTSSQAKTVILKLKTNSFVIKEKGRGKYKFNQETIGKIKKDGGY